MISPGRCPTRWRRCRFSNVRLKYVVLGRRKNCRKPKGIISGSTEASWHTTVRPQLPCNPMEIILIMASPTSKALTLVRLVPLMAIPPSTIPPTLRLSTCLVPNLMSSLLFPLLHPPQSRAQNPTVGQIQCPPHLDHTPSSLLSRKPQQQRRIHSQHTLLSLEQML